MTRRTAHDFDQELLILFYAYVHGALGRRAFLEKAAKFALSGVTALMLPDQLSPGFARRFALAAFAAFAPDVLFLLGGYPGNEDAARELIPAAVAAVGGGESGAGRLGRDR